MTELKLNPNKRFQWLSPLIVLVGLTFAATGLAKERPILPLSSSVAHIPAWETGLQDPAIARKSPTDDLGADSIKSDISELRGEYTLAKSKTAKFGISKNLVESYLQLSYFYENVLARKFSSQLSNKVAKRNFIDSRKMIIKFAKALKDQTQNKSLVAMADYHIYTSRYLLSYKQSTQVAALKKIKNLNSYLARRRDFVVHLHEASYGNGASRNNAAVRLAGIISKLPLNAAIAARLAVARHYAGLSRKGSIVSKKNDAYRGYLFGATDRAANLSDAYRDSVAKIAVAIWTRAEGNKIAWNKPPLRKSKYGSNKYYAASMERYGLSEWKKGNFRTSSSIFKVLAENSAGSIDALTFDKRYVRIKSEEAAKSKRPSRHEQALVYATEKYNDNAILGSSNTTKADAAKKNFTAQLDSLVSKELKKGMSSKASAQDRRRILALSYRHVERIESDAQKESLRAAIAKLHILNKQYTKGVDIYIDLALNGNGSKKASYLTSAINAQVILAKWPKKAPWGGINPGPASSREKLRDLYSELGKAKPSWATIANQGLLDVSLGNINAAIALWRPALENSKRSYHADRASGFLMHVYKTNKSWDELEQVARLSLKNKLKPISLKKSISPVSMLALALFEGGKSAYAQEKHEKAVAKLREFEKKFTRDSRHAEAMYYLGLAERGNAEYPTSILTMRKLVQVHSKSPFSKKGLILGGHWSMEQALEEDILFFYETFLKKYPRDNSRGLVQAPLLDVYLGKGMYSHAIAIYANRLNDGGLDKEQRIEAGKELVFIERRHGSLTRASKAAARLHKLVGSDDEIEALRLSLQAEKIASSKSKNSIKELKKLATSLNDLDKSIVEVADTLGHVRYQIAMGESKGTLIEFYNLALKDPIEFLQKQNSKFKRTVAAFEEVCQVGQNSFCAPSLFSTARLAEKVSSHIEDISIPQTLPQKTIATFNAQKQSFIDALTQVSIEYDEKAMSESKNGMTTPKWTQQIVWNGSSDWHFRSIQDKSGTAFVQIEPGDNNQVDQALRGDD